MKNYFNSFYLAYIIIFCLLVLICGIEIWVKIKAHNEPEVITYVQPNIIPVDTLHSQLNKLELDLIQYGDIVPEAELKDQLSNMYIMLAFQRKIDSLQQSRDNNEILYLRTRNDRYRVIGNKSDDNRVKLVKRYNKFIATL